MSPRPWNATSSSERFHVGDLLFLVARIVPGIVIHRRIDHLALEGNGGLALGDPLFLEDLRRRPSAHSTVIGGRP